MLNAGYSITFARGGSRPISVEHSGATPPGARRIIILLRRCRRRRLYCILFWHEFCTRMAHIRRPRPPSWSLARPHTQQWHTVAVPAVVLNTRVRVHHCGAHSHSHAYSVFHTRALPKCGRCALNVVRTRSAVCLYSGARCQRRPLRREGWGDGGWGMGGVGGRWWAR